MILNLTLLIQIPFILPPGDFCTARTGDQALVCFSDLRIKVITWRIIYPDVSKSRKLKGCKAPVLKPSEIIDGALDGTIQKIKVDPADNKRIYLGLAPLIDYMARGDRQMKKSNVCLVFSDRSWDHLESHCCICPAKVSGLFPITGIIR